MTTSQSFVISVYLRPPIAVVCRTSQAKEPIEWQADYFASSLLMPQAMLRRYWRSKHDVEGTSIQQIRQVMRANDIELDDAVTAFQSDRPRRLEESASRG